MNQRYHLAAIPDLSYRAVVLRPCATNVRRLRPGGWADFKHKLHRLGVLSSPVADVPEEWQRAFCTAYGRPYRW